MILKLKISPENVLSDLVNIEYDNVVFGVYSGMSNIISGSTDGSSHLTGLTIPLLITETINDLGYYSVFDGNINQKDSICNFIFSSTTENPYTYYVYNTSDDYFKFLSDSNYFIDWGDDSPIETLSGGISSHVYPNEDRVYNVTLTQENDWGANIISKKISIPYNNVNINNNIGSNIFISNVGSWADSPSEQDYIFDYDYNSDRIIYNNEIFVSAITKSRLTELSNYGINKYIVGAPIIKYGEIFGVIDDIGDGYTGYTIQDVKYFDYEEHTISIHKYSGITDFDVVNERITKDEFLIGIVEQPQIQTDLFVERGKVSPYENIMRIGEINNINDLEKYGYGFFKIANKT